MPGFVKTNPGTLSSETLHGEPAMPERLDFAKMTAAEN